MIRHWNKRYVLLISGIFISVLLIYGISYLYIIKPMEAEADILTSEAAMYEKQYEKITNQSGEAVDNQELASVGLLVPDQKSPDDVLLNLQKLAGSSNVTIDYIQSIILDKSLQEEEGSSAALNQSVYFLEASANSLNDVNAFLEKILKSDRLMIIETVDVQTDGEQVYLTITFTAFYLGQLLMED